MFTPTLRCECAQPGLIDTMRKWSICLTLSYRSSKLAEKKSPETDHYHPLLFPFSCPK